jgi:hypothetical protein
LFHEALHVVQINQLVVEFVDFSLLAFDSFDLVQFAVTAPRASSPSPKDHL